MNKISLKFLFYFWCLISVSFPVYAYIDPGTGSLMVQALIGLMASAIVALKLYWQKIKTIFLKKDIFSVDEENADKSHKEKVDD